MAQKSKNKTRWGCVAIPFIIALLIIVIIKPDENGEPLLARTSLPSIATEIQEHYESTIIPPEFHSLVKARMPKDEVEAYAHKVGATIKETGETIGEYLSWVGGPTWFKPKKHPLYYYHEQQYRVLVGWEDGYVYFDATGW